jgi:uncharacterized membrane protein YdjX (TVP38/TMEM64 family)
MRLPGLAFWATLVLPGFTGLACWALVERDTLVDALSTTRTLIADRGALAAWLARWGVVTPLFVISLQIFQVLLAPVPGEATGFIGGYLFGPAAGFFYSTVGLTLGSWLNFGVSRRLGREPVRRWISPRRLERFDQLMKRQGALAAFALFLIPGFPKDYLCLFLGLSRMSWRLFLPLVAVGRVPGTLMLSFQGAALADHDYGVLAVLVACCMLILGLLVVYRNDVYRWIERLDRGVDV